MPPAVSCCVVGWLWLNQQCSFPLGGAQLLIDLFLSCDKYLSDHLQHLAEEVDFAEEFWRRVTQEVVRMRTISKHWKDVIMLCYLYFAEVLFIVIPTSMDGYSLLFFACQLSADFCAMWDCFHCKLLSLFIVLAGGDAGIWDPLKKRNSIIKSFSFWKLLQVCKIYVL